MSPTVFPPGSPKSGSRGAPGGPPGGPPAGGPAGAEISAPGAPRPGRARRAPGAPPAPPGAPPGPLRSRSWRQTLRGVFMPPGRVGLGSAQRRITGRQGELQSAPRRVSGGNRIAAGAVRRSTAKQEAVFGSVPRAEATAHDTLALASKRTQILRRLPPLFRRAPSREELHGGTPERNSRGPQQRVCGMGG